MSVRFLLPMKAQLKMGAKCDIMIGPQGSNFFNAFWMKTGSITLQMYYGPPSNVSNVVELSKEAKEYPIISAHIALWSQEFDMVYLDDNYFDFCVKKFEMGLESYVSYCSAPFRNYQGPLLCYYDNVKAFIENGFKKINNRKRFM